MKFYIAHYRTYDGEHEYVEYGVFASHSYETGVKRAEKGKRFFSRYGWQEYCRLNRLEEIPKQDYLILKKYFSKI
jgi:hypothetical protein